MKVERTEIPKKYRDAVDHWCKHNFPDYPILEKYWDKYFPNDEPFCLCAKMDVSTSKEIVVGDHAGEPKSEEPTELGEGERPQQRDRASDRPRHEGETA